MDAASLSAAHSSSSGSVSLRPGGRAAAVSFRPFTSSFLSDDVASLNERIRYTRDGLLRFQELWTQPPDELVEAGLTRLMSRGDDLLQEDDCTRRDPGGMGGPEPVALPVGTDPRDWRARNPPPPLQAVVQQQQLQRTPNKQRNDKNERNERDRNENNTRGSKDQTNAQASLPLQQQQQPPQPPENNPLSENRAVTHHCQGCQSLVGSQRCTIKEGLQNREGDLEQAHAGEVRFAARADDAGGDFVS
ncbi:unnamed protein product [Sphagnum balticum]